jgi:hypothetical protein
MEDDLLHQIEDGKHAAIFSQRFTQNNKIQEWLQSVGSLNTFLSYIEADTHESNVTLESSREDVLLGESDGYCLTDTRKKSKVPRKLKSSTYFPRKISILTDDIILDCKVVSQICRVGDIILSYLHQYNFITEDVLVSIIQQMVEKLHTFADDTLSLYLDIKTHSSLFPSQELLENFNAMMHLTLSCMSKISGRDHVSVFIQTLDKVLQSSTRFLTLSNAPHDESFISLRLNVQCCAVLVISAITTSDNLTLAFGTDQLFHSCRIKCCRFAGDSLCLLRSMKVTGGSEEFTDIDIDILRSSIVLLTTTILGSIGAKISAAVTAFRSFQIDFLDIVESFNILDAVSYHFEMLCTAATLRYGRKDIENIHRPAFEIIDSLLTFVFAMCGSGELLRSLIVHSQLIQVVIKNSLLSVTVD